MGNPSPPGEGRGEGNGTCRGPVSVVFCPASASLQRPAQEELHPLPFPSPSGLGFPTNSSGFFDGLGQAAYRGP